MQVNPEVLGCSHDLTKDFMGWVAKHRQHVATVESQRALAHEFTIHGEELEKVEGFKYLGHLVSFGDNNL